MVRMKSDIGRENAPMPNSRVSYGSAVFWCLSFLNVQQPSKTGGTSQSDPLLPYVGIRVSLLDLLRIRSPTAEPVELMHNTIATELWIKQGPQTRKKETCISVGYLGRENLLGDASG